MANLARLPADVRKKMAQDLGHLIYRHEQRRARSAQTLSMAAPLPTNIRLGEDLETWMLTPADFQSGANRIEGLAKPTGYWHHLVYHAGVPAQIAGSNRLATEAEWTVKSLFTSPLPACLGRAMAWIDRKDKSEESARYLRVPVFGLHAFWLVAPEADRVVVGFMSSPIDGLAYERFYQPQEFLTALARHPIPTLSGLK